MTDRELLEAAAKTAGISGTFYEDGWDCWIVGKDENGEELRWNALSDDGDALRLAVSLGCVVLIDHAVCGDGLTAVDLMGSPEHFAEPHGSDQMVATRRAIVRAAAAKRNTGAAT